MPCVTRPGPSRSLDTVAAVALGLRAPHGRGRGGTGLAKEREGTIAFAMVTEPQGMRQTALGESADLRAALRPGVRIETYNREWVMDRPDELSRGLVHGHIGIVSQMDRWDDTTMRFLSDDLEAGIATPYVLDPDSGRLVFQTRGSTIKPQSFVNAFEKLINESSPDRWRVVLAEREMDWSTFLRMVEAVESMTIRLEKPNPRFPNDLAESLVRDTEAASATLNLRGEDIETDAEVVRLLMEHADRYGYTNARGRTRRGLLRYVGRRNTTQVTAHVPADPETGEVSQEDLREQVERWSDIDFFTEE